MIPHFDKLRNGLKKDGSLKLWSNHKKGRHGEPYKCKPYKGSTWLNCKLPNDRKCHCSGIKIKCAARV